MVEGIRMKRNTVEKALTLGPPSRWLPEATRSVVEAFSKAIQTISLRI
jgi:hypothetical protein